MQTIELTARSLAGLVRPVIPFADHSGFTPILGSVRLSVHGDYLTAAATDRFRVGIKRLRLDDAPDGFEAVVPLAAIKQLLTVFKPTRLLDPVVTLSVEDGRLTAVQAYGMDFEQAKFTFALAVGDYPKIESVLVGHKPQPSESIAVHAKYLADFKSAVTTGEPLEVSFGGHMKPVIVTAGEDFIGAVMPVRPQREDGGTGSAFSDWIDFLAPAKKAEVA